jgi:acetyl esterase/lipase
MSWLFLVVAVGSALLTFNLFRPAHGSHMLSGTTFVAGWLIGELVVHHIVWEALAMLAFIALGAVHGWPGWLALGLMFSAWLGLWISLWQSLRAPKVIDAAIEEGLGVKPGDSVAPELEQRMREPLPRTHLLRPFRFGDSAVEVIEDIPYAERGGARNLLDIHRPRHLQARAPVVLQIHGGAWVMGHKRQQALPMLTDLASRGFVCVSANYRLSPRATFPAQLIDVKMALVWIRLHIAEYGGDPDCVVVTGGSAGGHLAALLALTPNRPEYQPGFEGVDTRVQGCMPFYGVYDLAGISDAPPSPALIGLWERSVLKQPHATARAAFEEASPFKHLSADVPPFFVVHGSHDSLVPVRGARSFVAALRRESHAPVVYAELPMAQHAFDIFHSIRTHELIRGVHRFLTYVVSQHQREQRGAA